MPYATINKPTQHFNTVTYTADDTSPRTLTGFGHQPDFVWVKHRGSGSVSHTLVNRVRGGDKMLASNGVGSEDAKSHGEITSWNADGITVADGTNGTYPRLYFNDFDPFGASVGGNYVAWSWKADGVGSVNTAGTLSSTVSANITSGFSICRITEASSVSGVQTFGHGLGVAPAMVIYRQANSNSNWQVYHKSTGTGLLQLNNTNAVNTSATYFPSSTSTLFGLSPNVQGANAISIAYCFAEVKGFSKMGSYVGNGSTDGTFIYTGFKPAFVIVKASSTAGQWSICDNRRGTANTANGEFLFAEIPDALNAAVNNWDFVSNGFKARANYAAHNTSGVTYIYMAFAEQPLVGTNNVPATAR
jgi:hypothetical protein